MKSQGIGYSSILQCFQWQQFQMRHCLMQFQYPATLLKLCADSKNNVILNYRFAHHDHYYSCFNAVFLQYYSALLHFITQPCHTSLLPAWLDLLLLLFLFIVTPVNCLTNGLTLQQDALHLGTRKCYLVFSVFSIPHVCYI